MNERLLIIDDDARLSAMVRDYLAARGYEVDIAHDSESGLQALARRDYDAVVLDVMMPDRDGFQTLALIRTKSAIPVVMLTARGDADDRIVGLELGADDYLPKPFNPRELLARLRAVLRRVSGMKQSEEIRRFGRLEIDLGARQARVDGEERRLTSHQFSLLVALSEHPGRVLSRDSLMNAVRGEDLDAFDRSIDVHISRIRSAIEDDPKQPRRILTVRGAGYVFARAQS